MKIISLVTRKIQDGERDIKYLSYRKIGDDIIVMISHSSTTGLSELMYLPWSSLTSKYPCLKVISFQSNDMTLEFTVEHTWCDINMPSIALSDSIIVDGNGHWNFNVESNGRKIPCKISQEAVEDNGCSSGEQLYNEKKIEIEDFIRNMLKNNPNIDEIKIGYEALR